MDAHELTAQSEPIIVTAPIEQTIGPALLFALVAFVPLAVLDWVVISHRLAVAILLACSLPVIGAGLACSWKWFRHRYFQYRITQEGITCVTRAGERWTFHWSEVVRVKRPPRFTRMERLGYRVSPLVIFFIRPASERQPFRKVRIYGWQAPEMQSALLSHLPNLVTPATLHLHPELPRKARIILGALWVPYLAILAAFAIPVVFPMQYSADTYFLVALFSIPLFLPLLWINRTWFALFVVAAALGLHLMTQAAILARAAAMDTALNSTLAALNVAICVVVAAMILLPRRLTGSRFRVLSPMGVLVMGLAGYFLHPGVRVQHVEAVSMNPWTPNGDGFLSSRSQYGEQSETSYRWCSASGTLESSYVLPGRNASVQIVGQRMALVVTRLNDRRFLWLLMREKTEPIMLATGTAFILAPSPMHIWAMYAVMDDWKSAPSKRGLIDMASNPVRPLNLPSDSPIAKAWVQDDGVVLYLTGSPPEYETTTSGYDLPQESDLITPGEPYRLYQVQAGGEPELIFTAERPWISWRSPSDNVQINAAELVFEPTPHAREIRLDLSTTPPAVQEGAYPERSYLYLESPISLWPEMRLEREEGKLNRLLLVDETSGKKRFIRNISSYDIELFQQPSGDSFLLESVRFIPSEMTLRTLEDVLLYGGSTAGYERSAYLIHPPR